MGSRVAFGLGSWSKVSEKKATESGNDKASNIIASAQLKIHRFQVKHDTY